jgi:predicted RNA binding protein YcfA (HicA-like mRNA interferase family)
MSPKLPRRSATEVRRAIEKAGFVLSRQSGSHQIFRNSAGRRITLPVHAGKTIHPKILKRILADAELTADEFEKLV